MATLKNITSTLKMHARDFIVGVLLALNQMKTLINTLLYKQAMC